MPLSQTEKQNYIDAIHRIWPALSQYSADDVNEEAARVLKMVVADIDNASKGIAAVHELVKGLKDWFSAKGWVELTKEMAKTIIEVVDKLENGNKRYRIVIQTAALKYRSMMEIALMDI